MSFLSIFLAVPILAGGGAPPDLPESERIHRTYELPPAARVEVSGIAGPVEIETMSGDTVDIEVVRSAPTRADLDCGNIAIEQTSTGVRIRSESLCSVVRGSQRVRLTLPRRVDLSLENIAGDVRIGPTDGMVRLESIAGHVVSEELHAARMSSLASGVSLTIAEVGDRGIRLSSVTGGVDLGVRDRVNADLRLGSVAGRVHSDAPDIRISSENGSDYRAVLGSGGPKISIDSVVGLVTIHRAD